jgi:peptidoglycan hydrolase-like protein with peptidoglycan-binding domain
MTRRLVGFALVTLVVVLLPSPAGAAGDVEKAQRRLNALGCNAGPVDGKPGSWTKSAVIRFQSRHGLLTDGVLGPVTRKRLFARSAQRCDVRPVPKGSGKGRRIVLSQRQNWIWLVGPKGRVVAQGGLVDNPGVLHQGTYRSGSYCGRPARIARNGVASGQLWLDNFVRFAPCGVGFHRIPRYVSSGAQIHADWILGTNLAESHGCVRLSNAMSRRVWTFTRHATKVRVIRG